ncbi:hypothetical protein SARC_10106 [Sphaeroforma arctica JP610]|uniref:Uncharacterized protein n=1 Tax=Sphaeroforma arctica JP610 TaxID=667725 RepID=A0A0L0FKW6_9EUKA|nr:hypothetical protein SARC_10106 [Sphaeroforma arctica JP610]KNC77432.1 hypothetical protein SARC_10106 [Sphaeroforma arctica JP610]|eukprot:XP_014151334.1 hypothetical protein SARC_10106 [Sphaeroforma arctica JP610]
MEVISRKLSATMWGTKRSAKKQVVSKANLDGLIAIDIDGNDANTLTHLRAQQSDSGISNPVNAADKSLYKDDLVPETETDSGYEVSDISSEHKALGRKISAREKFGSPLSCSFTLCSYSPLPGVQHCGKHIHLDPNW